MYLKPKWLTVTVDIVDTNFLLAHVRYNIFTGCPEAKTCTVIMRGGAEQFIEETERSLHDAIMIVRRAIKNDAVVAGGGAIEMELSKYLRDYSRSIAGKEQLLIGSMARALEIIPRQLCDNAGFDATNILNKLRQKHFQGEKLSLLCTRQLTTILHHPPKYDNYSRNFHLINVHYCLVEERGVFKQIKPVESSQ